MYPRHFLQRWRYIGKGRERTSRPPSLIVLQLTFRVLTFALQNGNALEANAQEVPSTMPDAQQKFIALVDLSCNEEFLELVKSALLAAVESLPLNASLGLITFSTKVSAAKLLDVNWQLRTAQSCASDLLADEYKFSTQCQACRRLCSYAALLSSPPVAGLGVL